jgi:hypothetical protein
MGKQVPNAMCAVLYWHYVWETKENHEKTVGKMTGLISAVADLMTLNAIVLMSFKGCQ